MPLYPISTKGSDDKRVVKADNPAAALKHAATGMFTIGKPLGADDVVTFMSGGGKVETVATTDA